MNRMGLGLAVGAGYVLGRTKKAKLALAVGSLVAGKRMNLSPRAVADLVSGQLRDNPQFKEIGDQLREDLRGVGKAASGAMVERRIDALADRLHGRTAEVRDQLAGVVPEAGSEEEDDEAGERAENADDAEDTDSADGSEAEGPDDAEDEPEPPRGRAAKKAPAKKAPAKKAPAKKASAPQRSAKKAAKKAPAKKTADRKSTARKTAGKKGGGER